MIQLEGLSTLQRELAQRIWEIQDHDALVEFVQSLPRSVAIEAHTVIQMIIIEGMEQEEIGDMIEANKVIERIRAC